MAMDGDIKHETIRPPLADHNAWPKLKSMDYSALSDMQHFLKNI